jgi:hypothetical protein
LDSTFFQGTYVKSGILSLVAALLFLGFDQKTAALGVLSGAAMGAFSLWTCEMTVKLLFNGGGFSGLKLIIGACVKMPLFLATLLTIGWACFNGYMNAFAVVGGILLVHGTMLIKVISTAAAAQATNRERYR